MLICRYTDPPLTDKEKEKQDKQRQAGKAVQEPLEGYDITNYVLKYNWSGDIDQAARKLDFSIAYNTQDKDETFPILDLKLGGFVTMNEIQEETETETEFFLGRIFFRKRCTDGFTFEFTAYDDMIYLAKSHVQMVIDGNVTSAITQICNQVNVPVDDKMPDIPTYVSFVVDDKSCTEVFKMLFEKARADPSVGKDYTAICIGGDVSVVEKGETINSYVATGHTNVISSEHSESIEDMVNRVVAVDKKGNICQVFTIKDDANKYGMVQQVYKMQPPKEKETVDNVAGAKAKLKQIKNESSLKGTGDIQCIAGYCITIQEEQLKGKFFIKSDTHDFENGQHTMSLTLEYMPDTQEEPEIEQADTATPIFRTSKIGRKRKRRGKQSEAS